VNPLQKLHPVLIHFVIVGVTLGALVTVVNSLFQLFGYRKYQELLEKFSILNLLVALFFYPLVAITGIIDAQSFDIAVSRDLLALKIILGFFTIYTFLLLLLLVGMVYANHGQFCDHAELQFLYTLLFSILGVLILFTATLGGLFVFGHSAFDTVGLGFLVPQAINQPTNNLFDTVQEAIFYSPLATIALSLLFVVILLILIKLFPKLSTPFSSTLV